jgi:hypothetical protein
LNIITVVFDLTPEERERLTRVRFFCRDEKAWALFARAIAEQLVNAYSAGEITVERVLDVMWSCSLGCALAERARLLAFVSRVTLISRPRKKKKQQANPLWVKSSAASLVQMLREDRPNEPWAPNESNDWSTPILRDAIEVLAALRLCDWIGPRTLYDWCLKADTQSNPATTA